MSKSLAEILGGRNMTGVFKSVQSGLPNYLPPAFLTPTRRVIGNTATYFKVEGAREHATTNTYGAPAKIVNGKLMTEVGITLAHVFEQMNHNPVVLQNIQGYNGEPARELAVEEIDRQSVEFKRRCDNTRLGAVYSTLANGKVFLGSNGQLLFSSSGAVVTIDWGVPANNLNQLNGIIGASWGTASTDIIGDLVAIKKAQVQAGKPPLKYAFYGSSIPTYIAANTEASILINRTPQLAMERYLMAEIPQGFGGFTWVPAYAAYGLLDGTSTVTDWWTGDTVVFTPEPSPDWWGFYEGSFPVPNNIGQVYSDAGPAAGAFNIEYGMFSYATVGHNPATISQFAGDTFLPVLRDPAAVMIADVVP